MMMMILTQKSLMFRLLVLLLFSSAIPTYSQQADVKSWCGKTPYPQPCVYYLSGHPTLNVSISQKPDFLALSIRLALDRANLARDHTHSLGSKCRDESEKAAWYDCLQLYDQTILRLNHTVGLQCTQTDAQTWLSTALTNLETCHAGFAELAVTDYVFPMMSNNVSKLISNALALNYAPYSPSTEYSGGLPTWLKPGDRKLLQASSPASQANIVVAQDGSGNYKTINEAITAASKRSGTSRYIIYIKTGVYNENVEVGNKLKNIMFVGDGMGKTIITGSRSVGGGYTTFRSATVAAVGDGFIARDLTIRNTAGSSTANRVKWGGYHTINSSTEASRFTVGSFIAGNSWLPATGVAFTAGL
ncbi:hypothetical protein MLD38_018517 [Melastoma candidum]|uniref:Uncharacterized protein n=1 Tax=Melastoma candidum TaxID=119954 RepID=A0ACB9QTH7_9MYRT|nr:hypothetical protein MLD38_018517 [Melastoma candidum]